MPDELSLTVLRRLVRKGLGGLDEDDLSDEDVDLYLNLSLWNISDKFAFKEKEALSLISTVIGQVEYIVPEPLDALHSMAYVDPDTGKTRKLIRMDWDHYEQIRDEGEDENDETPRGRPRRFVRRGDNFFVHPIPDKVYELRVAFWRTIASLVIGDVNTVDLPRNWQEMVVEGAVTRGHYYNEDYTLAQQADNFRVGHERSAVLAQDKEERDNKYARLRVIDEFPGDEHEDFPAHWRDQMSGPGTEFE